VLARTFAIIMLLGLSTVTFSTVAHAASVPFVNLDPATDLAQSPGPGMYFGFTDSNVNGLIGWSFTITQPVTVTELGWYDDGQDGLSHAHTMGIVNGQVVSLSNPLALVTIPDSTQATLEGPYRVEPIAPVTLVPGTYSLVGQDFTDSPDPINFGGPEVVPLPLDPRADSFGTTPTPISSKGILLVNGLWMGPMMFVQPVPEPSTLMLAVLGCLGLLAVGRHHLAR
jgi:hypothetical protein